MPSRYHESVEYEVQVAFPKQEAIIILVQVLE